MVSACLRCVHVSVLLNPWWLNIKPLSKRICRCLGLWWVKQTKCLPLLSLWLLSFLDFPLVRQMKRYCCYQQLHMVIFMITIIPWFSLVRRMKRWSNSSCTLLSLWLLSYLDFSWSDGWIGVPPAAAHDYLYDYYHTLIFLGQMDEEVIQQQLHIVIFMITIIPWFFLVRWMNRCSTSSCTWLSLWLLSYLDFPWSDGWRGDPTAAAHCYLYDYYHTLIFLGQTDEEVIQQQLHIVIFMITIIPWFSLVRRMKRWSNSSCTLLSLWLLSYLDFPWSDGWRGDPTAAAHCYLYDYYHTLIFLGQADEEVFHQQLHMIHSILTELTKVDAEQGNVGKLERSLFQSTLESMLPGVDEETMAAIMRAAETELDEKDMLEVEYKHLFTEVMMMMMMMMMVVVVVVVVVVVGLW